MTYFLSRVGAVLLGLVGLTLPAALAQPTNSQPFRHANTFVVHTADSTARAMRTLRSILTEQGFTLQRADSSSILTDERTIRYKGKATSFQILATVFPWPQHTPPTRLLLFAIGPQPAAYRGKEGRPSRQAFRLVEAVANAYPGGRLEYQANQ